MQIVCFKRDMRLEDNAAFTGACATGETVLPLYIIEPTLWQLPDMSQRHYLFLQESLAELTTALKQRGSRLIIRVGEAVDVLEQLRSNSPSKVYGRIRKLGTAGYTRGISGCSDGRVNMGLPGRNHPSMV